jgi:hypothetical protein
MRACDKVEVEGAELSLLEVRAEVRAWTKAEVSAN